MNPAICTICVHRREGHVYWCKAKTDRPKGECDTFTKRPEHPHVDSNLTFEEALNRHPEIFGHPRILEFIQEFQNEIDELKVEISDIAEQENETICDLDKEVTKLQRGIKTLQNENEHLHHVIDDFKKLAAKLENENFDLEDLVTKLEDENFDLKQW